MTHKGKRFVLTPDPGVGAGSSRLEVTLDEGLVLNQFMAENRNVEHVRDKIQGQSLLTALHSG